MEIVHGLKIPTEFVVEAQDLDDQARAEFERRGRARFLCGPRSQAAQDLSLELRQNGWSGG
jgi:hypothetical protein